MSSLRHTFASRCGINAHVSNVATICAARLISANIFTVWRMVLSQTIPLHRTLASNQIVAALSLIMFRDFISILDFFGTRWIVYGEPVSTEETEPSLRTTESMCAAARNAPKVGTAVLTAAILLPSVEIDYVSTTLTSAVSVAIPQQDVVITSAVFVVWPMDNQISYCLSVLT